MEELVNTMLTAIGAYGLKVVGGILILIGGWMLAGWVGAKVRSWSRRTDKIDDTLGNFLARMTRAAVLVFTVIAVLNSFGVQTASIIAVLAAMGLAVGLALQGTMSNVASGIVLLVLRPISVGEFVEAGGVAGTVKDIGLFATHLDTPQGVRIIVPNSAIASSTVKNFATNPIRRADMLFGIGYGDNLDQAMKIVRDILEADSRVLKDPALTLGIAELADSSVNFFVRPWVNNADFWGVIGDTTKKTKEAFDAAGISIPYPQQDVHMHNAG